jgi:CheY-like chemotaxis protein
VPGVKRPHLEVLVVERDAAVRAAVAGILRRASHSVATATGAQEALGLGTPDVVVCAVELDGMDGLALLEALRRRGQVVRAVLMTALPNLEDCRRALRLGAAELLVKPMDPGELVSAVEGGAPLAPLPADALRFHRALGATIEEAELTVRELVAQLVRWGIGPTPRVRVATAAVELLDNAVRHAYPREPGPGGPIEVEARCDGRQVELVVRDLGIGFEARPDDSGALGDPARSGLARAAALAESLRIDTSPGGGTAARVCFAVYRSGFDERGAIDLSELDWLTPGMSRRVLEILRAGKAEEAFHLSPAMAVTVGRLLSGPRPLESAQEALWSPA